MDRVTFYNPVASQTDADPFTSACGPNRAMQVAVSRDLFRSKLDCGDLLEVYVDDVLIGEYVVWDTMHPRWTNTLDVMTDTEFAWGKASGHVIEVGVDSGG